MKPLAVMMKMSENKYYSADLSISIVEIKATTRAGAEAIMQEFVDKIAPIMDTKLRWDEANWEIEKHVLDEKEGVWHTE
jgi:hypothetical protein